jgi:hypothetical protein
MVYFYLEQNNFMPTIQKIQKNLDPEIVGGEYDFSFWNLDNEDFNFRLASSI